MTIRWNAVRGLVMFAAVLAVAGCSVNDKERPADVEAASPNASASPSPTVTPTASPSSLSADPAGEKACNEVKTIKVNDLRADVNTLYEAGQAGSESVNGEVKQKSQLLGDFAAAASVAIQAGGDPAQYRDQLSGMVTDLLAVCSQYGYI